MLLFAMAGCDDLGEPGKGWRVDYDLVDRLSQRTVAPPRDAGEDEAQSSGDVILLPAGSRLDFFLDFRKGSRFMLDALGFRGEGAARMFVAVETFTGEGVLLKELRPVASGDDLTVIVPYTGIGKLSIAVPPEVRGRFVLRGPRVVSRERLIDSRAELERPPNVIVYLVDTLRADHLEVYGYSRPTSPSLMVFSERGMVFEDAVTQSPWTRPSVASLLTGLEPQEHDVNQRDQALPEDLDTLPELLSEVGYSTAAFMTNGNVGKEYGFAQGFDWWSKTRNLRYRSHIVHGSILEYLDRSDLREPFFMYVHAVDPHAPYEPGPEYRERFFATEIPEHLGSIDYLNQLRRERQGHLRLPSDDLTSKIVRLYDAEIAENDEYFGKLLQELQRRGLYEQSLIIFVSDHGEEFWEHGDWSHGHTLHDELLRMALIVKAPGSAPAGRTDALAQHIDLFQTVLDYAGLSVLEDRPGRSLRPILEGKEPEPTSPVFSTMDIDGRQGASLTTAEWKFIGIYDQEGRSLDSLFHRPSDPGETKNVIGDYPIVAAYFREERRWRLQQRPRRSSREVEVSKELKRELQALGYVD